MAGQWVRDPFGRAEFRYQDGTTLTSHVATGGVVSTAPPMAARAQRSNGLLIAAGVMVILQAVFALVGGVDVVLRSVDGKDPNVTSGTRLGLVAIGAIVAVLALGLLAAGIGCLHAVRWAIITTIVMQSLVLLLNLINILALDAEYSGRPFLGIGYVGVVLCLATSGMRRLHRA